MRRGSDDCEIETMRVLADLASTLFSLGTRRSRDFSPLAPFGER